MYCLEKHIPQRVREGGEKKQRRGKGKEVEEGRNRGGRRKEEGEGTEEEKNRGGESRGK